LDESKSAPVKGGAFLFRRDFGSEIGDGKPRLPRSKSPIANLKSPGRVRMVIVIGRFG
jgi:hypothetical protein